MAIYWVGIGTILSWWALRADRRVQRGEAKHQWSHSFLLQILWVALQFLVVGVVWIIVQFLIER